LTIIEKAGGNTKTIWSQLRKLMGHNGNNAKTVEHVLVGGKLRDKPAEVADALNNYFIDSVENISKCFSSEYKNTLGQVEQTEQAFNIEYITEADVVRVIRSLRPSRAKDVIGMNTVMLKELSELLVYPITKIVNLSIAQGLFPNVWKLAAVFPVFKGGDRLSVCNYRPI